MARIKPTRRLWVQIGLASAMSATAGMGIMYWSLSPHASVALACQAPPLRPAAPNPSPVAPVSSSLTDRERAVLSRLAQLPDLPVHGEPEFTLSRPVSVSLDNQRAAQADAARRSAGTALSRKDKHPADGAALGSTGQRTASALSGGVLEGEATLIDIEVVAVERGRLYYRAVDGMTHVAAPGERLLGVDGHVVRIHGDQVDLQINGHALTVSATST